MKKKIHPEIYLLHINCSCGNKMKIFSTLKKKFDIDVCYKCHVFYTGKQRISSSKGRIDNFRKRFGNINSLIF